MNQEPTNFEEQSRQAREATRRLKRNMVTVIVCLAVFAVVAVPLIGLLEEKEQTANAVGTQAPPSSIIFATPNYGYDIMTDYDYLNLNRTVYYYDERSGLTEALDEKNISSYGPAVTVLCSMIEALIAGDADAYNALFSENYFENHEAEDPFTMQRLYDIKLTKVSESTVSSDDGASYTQYEFEVEYKIRLNDGTFRTDIGHDESKKQYFILSDSTANEVLIDQILNYTYQN